MGKRMMLSNLNLLATAPGGVARLRELILTLAVQGKLVPQDPADEPASVLLQKIRAEKDRLIAEGKIKKDKPLAVIPDEEKPFELPVGWEWVRLGDVTNYGATVKAGALHPDTWVLDMEDIEKSSGRLLQRLLFAQRPALSDKNCFFAGDVLYGKLRPYLNKVLVADEDGVCTTEIVPFRCYGDYVPQYFRMALSSPFFQEYVNARSYGMKMPRLGTQDARNALIPLPPIAEQSRIVARVEELMRLCDALEAKGQLEATQHAQLLSTLLGTLTASATPEELADNWQRVAQHFDLLLDRPEAIDALEQTLLQLAVRGLLVPQDPADEPASVLLQKIRAEKDRLITEGKIKKDKPLPTIADEEKPFELPLGWEWVRLQQAYDVRDGTHDTPKYQSTGFPLVTSKNLYRGVLDLSDVKLISPVDHEQISARSRVDRDDILFAMIGSIGNPVIVDTDAEFSIKNVALFKYYAASLSCPKYLLFVLQSEAAGMKERAAGGVQSFVSLGQLRSTVVAFPPLAEQSRIVTRVTQLRRLCADLRQRLAERQSVQARLAEALVQQVA